MEAEELKNLAKLADPEEFRAEFARQQQTGKTNKQAYVATEAQYQQLFGKRKYSSFKSFETTLYRRIRRESQRRKRKIEKIKEKT